MGITALPQVWQCWIRQCRYLNPHLSSYLSILNTEHIWAGGAVTGCHCCIREQREVPPCPLPPNVPRGQSRSRLLPVAAVRDVVRCGLRCKLRCGMWCGMRCGLRAVVRNVVRCGMCVVWYGMRCGAGCGLWCGMWCGMQCVAVRDVVRAVVRDAVRGATPGPAPLGGRMPKGSALLSWSPGGFSPASLRIV